MEDKIRVKLVAPWASDDHIYKVWKRYARPDGTWNKLQVVNDDSYDWMVVHNYPNQPFDPRRTILYQHEPSGIRAQWPAEWQNPAYNAMALVHTIDQHYMPYHWYELYQKDWHQLVTEPINKSLAISAVISGKYHLPGGRDRVHFIFDHLSKINPPVHLYGRWDRKPPVATYFGEIEDKVNALHPYQYTIAAENCYERNYFTEKILDAIMSETLTFYSGCPNISDFIDPQCYIPITLSDPVKTVAVINEAIEGGLYEQRLPYIREEKRRILHEKSFFPMLERHIGQLMLGELCGTLSDEHTTKCSNNSVHPQ